MELVHFPPCELINTSSFSRAINSMIPVNTMVKPSSRFDGKSVLSSRGECFGDSTNGYTFSSMDSTLDFLGVGDVFMRRLTGLTTSSEEDSILAADLRLRTITSSELESDSGWGCFAAGPGYGVGGFLTGVGGLGVGGFLTGVGGLKVGGLF
jgi:hypothetical protein